MARTWLVPMVLGVLWGCMIGCGAAGAEGAEGAAKPGGAEGAAKPGGAEGAAKPGGAEGAAKPGGAEGAAKPGGAEGAAKPGGAEGAAKTGGAEGAAKPGGAEGAAKPGGAEAFLVTGKQVKGAVGWQNGVWQIGGQQYPQGEIVALYLTPEPPPARIGSGVWLNGGTLLLGRLESIRKDQASKKKRALVRAHSLERDLDLEAGVLAGAFYPLPLGQAENLPGLDSYLLARNSGWVSGLGAEGEGNLLLQPGRRARVTMINMDFIEGDLYPLKAQSATVQVPGGEIKNPVREAIRVIEFKSEPPAAPGAAEARQGREFFVRLKAGDLLRGWVVGLDEKELILETGFAGRLAIPRALLAALFPAGEGGGGWQWLSALKPARQEYVPFFDSNFPACAGASCNWRLMRMAGTVFDQGLGVHSLSRLEYALDGAAGRRLVAWVGIDDETKGRGSAEAKVFLDGKEAWKSGLLKPNSAALPVSLELGSARKLVLQVDYGPDQDDSGDHVDWGWAALVGK